MPPFYSLDAQIDAIKSEIKAEYRASHQQPWIIGFSGGKDSTLVLHLVIESLLELPWSERTRPIHVVANDTLVESPIISAYVEKILSRLSQSMNALNLNVIVEKTVPDINQTFWVNLIGRGYPPPTRLFRWCTDRMKIRPTTNYIRSKVSEKGEVVLLLGVRRTESSARSQSASRYDNGHRLNRHNDITSCFVYRPILELETEDVWNYLADTDAPWGGGHGELIKLYQDAAGDECLLVMDPDAAPSCGSTSIRFGCWTCSVVEKDRSFRAGIEQGFVHLEPMADFRDWLKVYGYEPENRMNVRRNGEAGKGPLTFEARETVLKHLLQLQKKVNERLISDAELNRIQRIWLEDKAQYAVSQANSLIGLMAIGDAHVPGFATAK
jgi:DNA sulfur modification protein DndC